MVVRIIFKNNLSNKNVNRFQQLLSNWITFDELSENGVFNHGIDKYKENSDTKKAGFQKNGKQE